MLDAKSRNQFGKNPNTNWYTEEWSCFLQHVFLKNIADRYWDIFHFSEIRLGLCNTWWMCSHEMLKKCLCWQRSGFKAFIMLCKMKKKPRLYLFQKYATCNYYYYFWARATYLHTYMFLILLYHSWFYHIIQAKD